MRASMRIVNGALALALAACNRNGPVDEAANADQALDAQAIGGNDTTAIDAATDQSANLAADVDYTDAPADDGDANNSVAASNTAN